MGYQSKATDLIRNRCSWRSFGGLAVETEKRKKLAGSADMQRLDMGIAMCHFKLVAEEVGLEGEWIETEPDLMLPKRCEYLVSWKKN